MRIGTALAASENPATLIESRRKRRLLMDGNVAIADEDNEQRGQISTTFSERVEGWFPEPFRALK
jgi:hypothetical protein